MSHNFRPYQQDQLFLMPPSLDEWVRDDSLARFLSDVVDALDDSGKLADFYARYRADGWGRAAYHPVMMVKVLLYGYSVGVRSSRKIAAALENDVGFRYLAANQRPDFRTISDFRKEHLAELEALFTESVRLCQEAGLAKLGRVAVDGRKVKGNAALESNRTREAIQKEVASILAEAEQLDKEEDARYGAETRGDELPEELRDRKGRLKRLREAQARLDAEAAEARTTQEAKLEARAAEERATGKKKRGRKPKPPEAMVKADSKANTTDPDSRIMKSRKGWVQGYNGQAMVDCDSQVIVAQALVQDENDLRQLGPMLDHCVKQAGQHPRECLADAGYWSEENAALQTDQTELFISTRKDWKRRKALRASGPPRGRIPNALTLTERMERKLCTKRGQEIYKQRGSSVEPVFGQMHERDLNEFLLRGAKKAAAEWSIFCATHNLLKLWRSGCHLIAGRGALQAA